MDPDTGEREDDEPMRTLKRYRHDAALRGVVFGRNAYALTGVAHEAVPWSRPLP